MAMKLRERKPVISETVETEFVIATAPNFNDKSIKITIKKRKLRSSVVISEPTKNETSRQKSKVKTTRKTKRKLPKPVSDTSTSTPLKTIENGNPATPMITNYFSQAPKIFPPIQTPNTSLNKSQCAYMMVDYSNDKKPQNDNEDPYEFFDDSPQSANKKRKVKVKRVAKKLKANTASSPAKRTYNKKIKPILTSVLNTPAISSVKNIPVNYKSTPLFPEEQQPLLNKGKPAIKMAELVNDSCDADISHCEALTSNDLSPIKKHSDELEDILDEFDARESLTMNDISLIRCDETPGAKTIERKDAVSPVKFGEGLDLVGEELIDELESGDFTYNKDDLIEKQQQASTPEDSRYSSFNDYPTTNANYTLPRLYDSPIKISPIKRNKKTVIDPLLMSSMSLRSPTKAKKKLCIENKESKLIEDENDEEEWTREKRLRKKKPKKTDEKAYQSWVADMSVKMEEFANFELVVE